jgi:hypothetical protein
VLMAWRGLTNKAIAGNWGSAAARSRRIAKPDAEVRNPQRRRPDALCA